MKIVRQIGQSCHNDQDEWKSKLTDKNNSEKTKLTLSFYIEKKKYDGLLEGMQQIESQ